jgi:hypothetical protein
MTHPARRLTLACLLLAPASTTVAAVTAIGPFTGHRTDTFDQYTTTMAVRTLPVFDGAGSINVLGTGTSIKVEFSSQLNGDLVVPISGMMIGQLGIADWVFNVPARRFGGMWENNSGADHATVTFFDEADNLIGTHVASVPVHAQSWTWNGWQSDVPIKRIHVVGNGLINGFIWYENVQLDMIPEPAHAWVAAATFVGFTRGRRRG